MKIQFLRYFCVLAEELHFGRAADRLAISQPPLSIAIRALEDELGARLFVRNSKMVQLTPAGTAFRIEAQEVLERVDRMGSVVRAADAGLHGRLDIGMTSSLLYRDMPAVLAAFQREVPAVDVALHELSTSEQMDKLMRRQLHAAFVQTAAVPPSLQGLSLRTDHFMVCVPHDHAFAHKKSIELKALAADRFIVFSRDSAPASYDHVIGVFSRFGIHPEFAHAARTWMTTVAMVAKGYGVALVPQSLSGAGIVGARFLALKGMPSPVPASLMWSATNMPEALVSFIDSARKTLHGLETRSARQAQRKKASGSTSGS